MSAAPDRNVSVVRNVDVHHCNADQSSLQKESVKRGVSGVQAKNEQRSSERSQERNRPKARMGKFDPRITYPRGVNNSPAWTGQNS